MFGLTHALLSWRASACSRTTMNLVLVQSLLGQLASSDAVLSYLASISDGKIVGPDVKSYSDIVYYNYFSLGLSLQFVPAAQYKLESGLAERDLDRSRLILDAIDIYHAPLNPKPTSKLPFATYPHLPVTLQLAAAAEGEESKRPQTFEVSTSSMGKDFVEAFGEPARKGGGAGPSSGSIGIWCEWSTDGVLVEFGGDEARGPQAWERGKDAIWRVLTIYRPKDVESTPP